MSVRVCLVAVLVAGLAGAPVAWTSHLAKRVLHVADLPQTELLRDGTFEHVTGHWEADEDGFQTVADARTGDAALRMVGDMKRRCGIRQHIEFSTPTLAPVLVSGWSKAEGVLGPATTEYSVFIDITYVDGKPQWGQTVQFDGGTHDWQYREKLVIPERPLKSLDIYAIFRSRMGTVWFDDLSARVLSLPEGTTTFDGAVVAEDRGLPATEDEIPLSTGDGLALRIDRRSGAARVEQATGRAVSSGASSGFLLRDVAGDSGFHAPRGFVRPTERGARQRGVIEELGLRLDAEYDVDGERIEVTGTVRDLTTRDRAVTVYYALPMDATGWTWWDNIRASRQITPERDCRNYTDDHVGAMGHHSRYPFACINSGDASLTVAVPLDWPRIARMAYDSRSRQLYVAFDLALTGLTRRFPHRANFRFTLYTSDPAWGLRAAASKYYDIYPDFFVNRTPRQGIWMAFLDIAKLPNPEDFGFQFEEAGPNIRWDNAHGITYFTYIEPASIEQHMPKDQPYPWTYEQAMAAFERNKQDGAEWNWGAWQAEMSGAKDRDGRFILDYIWGRRFMLNPSPGVPTDGTHPSRGQTNIAGPINDIERGGNGGYSVDGTFVDSTETWGWVRNFRREHLEASTLPLTFAIDTREPVLLNAFSIYEFCEGLEREMRQRGKLMSSNGVPAHWACLARFFDVLATEVTWSQGDKWRPTGHADLAKWRTLAYQRPFCLIQNCDFSWFGPALVEKYFQWSLFYGMFPSFFTTATNSEDYFREAKYYERDRPLFRKYVPIIREVAEAGWEPVTYAAASDPNVWIERFGPSSDGAVYLTLLNTAGNAGQTAIQVDRAALGIPAGAEPVEMVSGRALDARGGAIETRLEPEEVIAIRFSRAR